MSGKPSEARINELVALMSDLEQLHAQLLSQTEAKIAAMKINDLPAIQNATAQEGQLVARIAGQDGVRRQLMATIAREAGWPLREAGMLSATQLAGRCPGPQRQKLLDASARLRGRFMAVARATRIAGGIAAGILEHLQYIFSEVRSREITCLGYSGSGKAVVGQSSGAFEVVG